MAAVIGRAAVLAAPAGGQSLDFYVDRARDECMTTLLGCKTAAGNAQAMLVFPRVRAATGGDSTDGALLVSNRIQGYYETALM